MRNLFLTFAFLLLTSLVYADPMTLNWVDNSGKNNDAEDGFNIYRSINGSVESKVGSVGPNVTTYNENIAQTNIAQKVCYSVASFNKAGESAHVAATPCKTVLALPPVVSAPPANVTLSFQGATGTITIGGTKQTFDNADGVIDITAANTMALDAKRLPAAPAAASQKVKGKR